MAPNDGWLTIGDIAKLRGTAYQSAAEWVGRNAKSHMRKVGHRWAIPASIYRILTSPGDIYRMDRTIARLGERLSELEARTDGHAEALRKLNAR